MPRQLRDPYSMLELPERVAQIEEGGTGASTATEAAINLNALSRFQLGVPGGAAMADSNGQFPVPAKSIPAGEAIHGPRQIARGATVYYYITNYDSRREVEVSVSAGQILKNGSEIQVTAPASGNQITLTVGSRSFVIPLVEAGLVKPLIVFPSANHRFDTQAVTVVMDQFQYSPSVYGPWLDISTLDGGSEFEGLYNGMIEFPAGAHAVEVEGYSGSDGSLEVESSGEYYMFPTSEFRRTFQKGLSDFLFIFLRGDAGIRWRFIYSGGTHTATDWQVATDPEFTNIVRESLDNTVNLISWSTELPAGTYYARARFKGQTT